MGIYLNHDRDKFEETINFSIRISKILLLILFVVQILVSSCSVYAYEMDEQQLEEYLKQVDEQLDNDYRDADPATRESIKQQVRDIIMDSYEPQIEEGNSESNERQAEEDNGKEIIPVDTKEDFLEWVCFQLRDQKEEVYYDTNLIELYNNSKEVFRDIDNFYCEGNPLISSSYLGRYRDRPMNYSWGENYSQHGYRYRIGITASYKYTKEEIQSHMSDMSNLAKELQGDTDYKSVKAVHDYLTEHFEWGDGNGDDIVGFREGKMDCVGYAMATFALLTNMNIPVRIVDGYVFVDGEEYNNCWNVVELDGKWYNLDVSWDDNGEYETRYDWFLRNNEDFIQHVYGPDQYEIKKMISETSYPVEEGLFIANSENQKSVDDQTDNTENTESSALSIKDLLKKLLTSRAGLRFIVYIIALLVLIIRHRVEEGEIRKDIMTDDLSSDIAEYYRRNGIELEQLKENNRKEERKMLLNILLMAFIFVVLVGIVYGIAFLIVKCFMK